MSSWSEYEVSSTLFRYVVPFRFQGSFSDVCERTGSYARQLADLEAMRASLAKDRKKRDYFRQVKNGKTGDLPDLSALEKQIGEKEQNLADLTGQMYENYWPAASAKFRMDGIGTAGPYSCFSGQWSRVTEEDQNTESDLYPYIRNECRTEGDVFDSRKTGCEWALTPLPPHRKNDPGALLKLRYVLSENRSIDFDISRGGMILYRNQIGLFWYEASLKTQISDPEELVAFQYRFRELTYNSGAGKNGKVPNDSIVWRDDSSRPFSMGRWVAHQLSFLNGMKLEFLAPRNGQKAEAWCRDSAGNIPDKPQLFTYCYLTRKEPQEQGTDSASESADMDTLSFYLTNGYRQTYQFSDSLRKEILHPFQNVNWFATKEGVSYIAWENPAEQHTKNQTFQETIPRKYGMDYFLLYLKTLYQSFSLVLYAERIRQDFLAEGNEDRESISGTALLYKEINLFLTRNMATSVSFIHHQNEFYRYLKKQYYVSEDVNSVTAGLESLENYYQKIRMEQEEKEQAEQKAEEERQQKKQEESNGRIGFLISLFGITSGINDLVDLLTKGLQSFAQAVVDALSIAVIVIFVSLAVIWYVLPAWKSRKQARMERKNKNRGRQGDSNIMTEDDSASDNTRS